MNTLWNKLFYHIGHFNSNFIPIRCFYRLKGDNTMDSQYILCKTHERVATITINRPEKLNALNPDLLSQLKDTLTQLETTNNIRAVILRGAGEKAFSAGFDVNLFSSVFPRGNIEEIKQRVKNHPVRTVTDAISNFPYPMIAMINGYAFGAGLGLAMACDIRIVVETTKMGMPPAKIGIVYQYSGLKHFVNAIGVANAKEIFLLGRTFDPTYAKAIGLVHYVKPMDKLIPFTTKIAQELSENAPLAVLGMKQFFNRMAKGHSLTQEEEDWALQRVVEGYNSDDFAEGLLARKEKRKPIFQKK